MKLNASVKNVAIVMVGVFLAGTVMNALRDNDFVKSAIDGFDG